MLAVPGHALTVFCLPCPYAHAGMVWITGYIIVLLCVSPYLRKSDDKLQQVRFHRTIVHSSCPQPSLTHVVRVCDVCDVNFVDCSSGVVPDIVVR